MEDVLEFQCDPDEIIIVENARYGRMSIGRCVTRDYGYIGCGSDVTYIVAAKCAGRRHCRIVNIEALLSGVMKVCPADLKGYLQASIICVKGLMNQRILYLFVILTDFYHNIFVPNYHNNYL